MILPSPVAVCKHSECNNNKYTDRHTSLSHTLMTPQSTTKVTFDPSKSPFLSVCLLLSVPCPAWSYVGELC